MSCEKLRTHIVGARSLPTKSVIVYGDRAEVKRIVKCDLNEGRNELIIQNVSSVIERQSLRVDGGGAAIIQDVRYQELPLDTGDNENGKVRELEEQRSDLETEKASLDDELNILKKRVEVLEGVATQISRNISPSASTSESTDTNGIRVSSCSSSNNPAFVLSENTVSNLTNFLDFYGQTAGDLKAEIRKKTKEANCLLEKIDHLEREIDRLRCGLEYDRVRRNISIVVDAETAGPSELHVSYQVYCANWKPTYDIRVNTTNDNEQDSSIMICYYGVIEQNTGEDWNATELVLSTATPSVGGCVPTLPTLAAGFRSKSGRLKNGLSRRKPNSAASDEDMGFGSFDYNDFTDAAALQRLTAAAAAQPNSDLDYSIAASYEQLPSTCFAIAHPATIVSDGSEHKVMIAELAMDAKFIHETVPARAAAAYMTAIATNTSSLPLLPGSAAVYFNNSFVSKVHLKSILPGEEFCCSLGVDPSVKVEYKAATCFHEQIGFVSKCILQTHDQAVLVRNAKVNQAVQLTVREHIPKAVDEKIKVCVLTPDLRTMKTEAYLNEDNNLEWTVPLKPGEQRELHIKWSIEYPLHQTVTYKQVQRSLYI
ncbi:Protein F37C4.5 [Toxocara canis]|uniref:Protein F37C4.5 n=1 Tax=Toxocara canis TaxID=6265 RepID=A0A0B2W0L0_TOXCA|nr:Protein F37C4.5 [Toxocara canis]